MTNSGILCSAAVLLVALIGCGPKPAGPVTVETTTIKNLKQDGDFYVGGAPTPEGLDDMKARGVTTIVDLCQANEATFDEEAAARARGLRYIHLPMTSDLLTTQQADQFIDSLRAHDNEKVLIHCAGGNRAAAMYGLYLGAEKKCPADEAIRRAKQAGLKSEKLAEQVHREVEQRRELRDTASKP